MTISGTSEETAAAAPGMSARGTVIRSTGSWYEVATGDQVIQSKVRGKFRLEDTGHTNPVAVGDRVEIRLEKDGTGLITTIEQRDNRLCRRAAGRRIGLEHVIVANVDRVWAVQSIDFPVPSPGFIDRVLVMAGRDDIPAGVIFNKIDLLPEDDPRGFRNLIALYRRIGYPVVETAAISGRGLDDLRDAIRGQTIVLVGPSGTGKSTILNAIQPGFGARTGEVSAKTRKGKHTTTSVTLYPIDDGGGFVADTPGIREFGVLDFEPGDLAHYFKEFVPFIHDCRFPNCTHDHEPDCAIMEAVNRGDIHDVRYGSYLNILDSIRMGNKDTGR
jgi:ribosome biogenesis GTPase / thiamine phosphate phosphatase